MIGVKPVLIAASVALLITAAGVAYKKKVEGKPAWDLPERHNEISVDWERGVIDFPPPNPEEGPVWMVAYSRDNVWWESTRVSSSKNMLWQATIPSGCHSVRCWASGGRKPTYSVEFDNPRRHDDE